jgi:hypothetical protein
MRGKKIRVHLPIGGIGETVWPGVHPMQRDATKVA